MQEEAVDGVLLISPPMHGSKACLDASWVHRHFALAAQAPYPRVNQVWCLG